MSGDIYSMIASYFRYQRDIGVHDIVFDSGPDIAKLLAEPARRDAPEAAPPAGDGYGGGRSYAGGTPGQPPGGQRAAPGRSYGMTERYGGQGAGVLPVRAAAAGASKLDMLSIVDDLGMRKFERSARAQAAPQIPAYQPQPKASSAKRDKLTVLYREILKCGKCALSRGRTKAVFGTGSADGRLLIIGGAPSKQDDAAGLPFQGETGKLLDNIIAKMGLDKKINVFITYLQKCYGGGNPGGGESDNGNAGEAGFDNECARICRSILDEQIEIIDPKAILVFGRKEANFFLGNDNDIEFLRGMNHMYRDRIPVVVTYGLPLMVANPQSRHGAWEDIKRVDLVS